MTLYTCKCDATMWSQQCAAFLLLYHRAFSRDASLIVPSDSDRDLHSFAIIIESPSDDFPRTLSSLEYNLGSCSPPSLVSSPTRDAVGITGKQPSLDETTSFDESPYYWFSRGSARAFPLAVATTKARLNHGSQCTRHHGQGITEEANREHGLPGSHGTVVAFEKHRGVSAPRRLSHRRRRRRLSS